MQDQSTVSRLYPFWGEFKVRLRQKRKKTLIQVASPLGMKCKEPRQKEKREEKKKVE